MATKSKITKERKVNKTKRKTATKEKAGRRAKISAKREMRLERMETHLGRIDDTLATSSKLFVLMNERLENLEGGQQALVEGQQALVEGQQALVEGQKSLVVGQKALVEGQMLVVDRLDRLVEATTRDRTEWAVRWSDLERRVTALEERDPT